MIQSSDYAQCYNHQPSKNCNRKFPETYVSTRAHIKKFNGTFAGAELKIRTLIPNNELILGKINKLVKIGINKKAVL